MPRGDCYKKAGTIAFLIKTYNNKKMEACYINDNLYKKTPSYKKMITEDGLKLKDGYIEFHGKPKVVHAQVWHSTANFPYGHAFIIDDKFAYDLSNDRCIILPKDIYYKEAKIKKQKPYYYEYTPKQAIAKMVKEGHYGSWDLQTDSGL